VRVLIDTHIFLWWDRQLRSLSRPLRAAIADEANDIFVSAAGGDGSWHAGSPHATVRSRNARPRVIDGLGATPNRFSGRRSSRLPAVWPVDEGQELRCGG
jgi:hypothetical protein